MTARELAVIFGMETKKEDFDKLNQNIEGIKETAHRVLEVYVGEKVIHGLIDGMKEFGETSREIMDAQLLGLNTTQYQVLQQGAQMYGVQRQRFNMGMALMQRNAYEAIRGNKEAALTFSQLGVSVTDSNGKLKNAQVLLGQIADGMQKFKNDPTTRVALGEKLFGMRDLEFQNLLLKGSKGINDLEKDAVSLGFVMGHDTVEAGERFNRQMMRMSFIVDGFKNKLMGDLTPVINDLIEKVTKWVKANQGLINQKVKEFAQGLVDVITTLAQITYTILDVFRQFAGVVGGVSNAVKLLIYTFLAFKALDLVMGVWGIVKGFQALVTVLGLAFKGMGALMLETGAFLAVFTVLYYMIKDVWGFFHGQKSITGQVVNSIKYIANDAVGGAKDMIGDVGGRISNFTNNTGGGIKMHQHNEFNIIDAADPKKTAAHITEELDKKQNGMLKDAHRKLSFRQAY